MVESQRLNLFSHTSFFFFFNLTSAYHWPLNMPVLDQNSWQWAICYTCIGVGRIVTVLSS